MTLWHVDGRDRAGTPRGWGANFSWNTWVGEAYFRWKIGGHLEVAPNLQLLVSFALNPVDDEIWVIGLRVKGAI